MTTTAAPRTGELVDTDRYPLSSPGSSGWTAAVELAREELGRRGCCVLPGFLRSTVLEALRAAVRRTSRRPPTSTSRR